MSIEGRKLCSVGVPYVEKSENIQRMEKADKYPANNISYPKSINELVSTTRISIMDVSENGL